VALGFFWAQNSSLHSFAALQQANHVPCKNTAFVITSNIMVHPSLLLDPLAARRSTGASNELLVSMLKSGSSSNDCHEDSLLIIRSLFPEENNLLILLLISIITLLKGIKSL
jgi:hypothetical protein